MNVSFHNNGDKILREALIELLIIRTQNRFYRQVLNSNYQIAECFEIFKNVMDLDLASFTIQDRH
jgi:hypothetical protein